MATEKYPERNYVPMMPKGNDAKKAPPSDGSGKGNVAPILKNEPRGKGGNAKNYGGPNENYKSDTSK